MITDLVEGMEGVRSALGVRRDYGGAPTAREMAGSGRCHLHGHAVLSVLLLLLLHVFALVLHLLLCMLLLHMCML